MGALCVDPVGCAINDDAWLHVIAKDWLLVTVSYGGTVSLIKGLSESECQAAKSKVRGATLSDWTCGGMPCAHAVDPGEIKLAECFE